MLLFVVIRLIFVSNTPDIVHVPRITLNEEHYQFSFAKKIDNHLSLLSYDRWTGKREMEFAYYNDLYIQNPSNISDEFIVTTPARAPLNHFSESALFYFTFDPAIVYDYFKTKL